MKQFLRKTTAILMTFVVLFSTMSFTIDMHFCGGDLVDIALFGKAENCLMKMDKTIDNTDCLIVKKDCCDDNQTVVQGQDELQLTFDAISFNQQLFITSFIYTYINLFEGLQEQVIPFKNYNSPLVVKDIQKLDETYLI